MPRGPRLDAPDTWHHVMNRGIARRPIFENDPDRRFFLSLLAREVRAGRLEIHAYSLMLTHFHLLVRSLKGELSEAMRRIQNRYARWFNRTRKRDGPLFRGRFRSRPIDSLRYRRAVLTYIHDNAVAASLVTDPSDHEWSSAAHFGRADRPRWLAAGWIDSELLARGGAGGLGAQLAAAFPSQIEDDFRTWVERQLRQRLPEKIEDVTLKHAGSPRVVRWAIRKCLLADGTRPWRPVCRPGLAERVVAAAREKLGPLVGLLERSSKDAWTNLKAGLLRMLCGCTHAEIAMRAQRHESTISRDLRDHRGLLERVPRYAALVATLSHEALEGRAA